MSLLLLLLLLLSLERSWCFDWSDADAVCVSDCGW
jgi:hypothetical protein